jgi:hypothetical protein
MGDSIHFLALHRHGFRLSVRRQGARQGRLCIIRIDGGGHDPFHGLSLLSSGGEVCTCSALRNGVGTREGGL